jgi:hypothetical protein
VEKQPVVSFALRERIESTAPTDAIIPLSIVVSTVDSTLY